MGGRAGMEERQREKIVFVCTAVSGQKGAEKNTVDNMQRQEASIMD